MFFSKGVIIFTSIVHWRYNTLLLVGFLGLTACDPCRQLAEKMCQCRETEDERKTCTSNLSLANQHEYFAHINEPGVCEAALKDCDCIKLNNNDDAECGMYRRAAKQ